MGVDTNQINPIQIPKYEGKILLQLNEAIGEIRGAEVAKIVEELD
ncbi:hypothetical protein ACWOFR_14520 [Carnobacterium gallinarum]|nr:hypothetical protein [Carnobacterium gallinarum]